MFSVALSPAASPTWISLVALTWIVPSTSESVPVPVTCTGPVLIAVSDGALTVSVPALTTVPPV